MQERNCVRQNWPFRERHNCSHLPRHAIREKLRTIPPRFRPFCLLAILAERAPFLSFWPVSPEMRDGAVNQTCRRLRYGNEWLRKCAVVRVVSPEKFRCADCSRWYQMVLA